MPKADFRTWEVLGNHLPITASLVISYSVRDKMIKVNRRGKKYSTTVTSLFSWMSQFVMQFAANYTTDIYGEECKPEFPFKGGFVGYFGYEMSQESLSKYVELRPSEAPDAVFALLDRVIVVDRKNPDKIWLSCLTTKNLKDTKEWIQSIANRIKDYRATSTRTARKGGSESRCNDTREMYIEKIQKCQKYIQEGQTYQLCLTTQHAIENGDSALETYLRIRDYNPAPFGAFLDIASEELAVMSASPERFMAVKDSIVEMKPIKGTAKRDPLNPVKDEEYKTQLLNSIKERSENLMIVDLIRNDLATICPRVTVPKLMAVESYATVHQLVTTVHGHFTQNINPVDCIRACFPPGSMTGAPKLRSVQLLSNLEQQPRGIYSGIIGWISGTQCDFSVAIRTAVRTKKCTWVGAGGAITWLSDSEDEYEEMQLKAASIMPVL